MPGPVPPRINDYKPLFVVGYREGIILVIGGIPTLICLLAPWLPNSLVVIRIFLAVLLAGFTLVWALGRDRNSQATLEMRLLNWIEHNTQPKIYQRGHDAVSDRSQGPSFWEKLRNMSKPVEADVAPRAAITYRPIDISDMVILQIFSYAILASMIAWLATGGVQEVMRIFHR
jgi:hypothetical protein